MLAKLAGDCVVIDFIDWSFNQITRSEYEQTIIKTTNGFFGE